MKLVHKKKLVIECQEKFLERLEITLHDVGIQQEALRVSSKKIPFRGASVSAVHVETIIDPERYVPICEVLLSAFNDNEEISISIEDVMVSQHRERRGSVPRKHVPRLARLANELVSL